MNRSTTPYLPTLQGHSFSAAHMTFSSYFTHTAKWNVLGSIKIHYTLISTSKAFRRLVVICCPDNRRERGRGRGTEIALSMIQLESSTESHLPIWAKKNWWWKDWNPQHRLVVVLLVWLSEIGLLACLSYFVNNAHRSHTLASLKPSEKGQQSRAEPLVW